MPSPVDLATEAVIAAARAIAKHHGEPLFYGHIVPLQEALDALDRAEREEAAKCPECKGKGTTEEDCERGGSWVTVTCWSCAGSGKRPEGCQP
ncbi:MAG: hypothetical protein KGR26_11810 [Cyanobacteria bacterium REEB65]|nr:hypothetical protein [Cyanobacteria bacterium REEB65]